MTPLPVDPARALPSRVGSYRVVRELGRGGMGIVYLGEADDGTPAAVKVLRAAVLRTTDEASHRFHREATIRIDHPNVVRVLDAGIEDDLPYIAFELLEGEGLEARLLRGPLSPGELLPLSRDAASALAAAHEAGVVHRDLKPSNLFITNDGTLKILDFGIARLGAAGTRLTMTGSVVGTPAYLSPEQARGDLEVDGRTDLWSLGVVLYEALTGRSPFERRTALATMLAVQMEPPPRLSSLAPTTPSSLVAVVDRCLAKQREDRFPDARSLIAALSDVSPDDPHATPARSSGAPTALSLRSVTPSIVPGEERVVAVLLAGGLNAPSVLEHEVEAHGGTLLAIAGDRAIGLFGGASWEGDEVDRAVRAGLAARHACRHLAVASGRASQSGTVGIAGSALALAEAGLAAGLSGIAIDERSLSVLPGTYRAITAEAGLYEVLERSSVPEVTITAAPGPALVGRDAELAQMRFGLKSLLEERRCVALYVTGAPGIGKSRLRAEMARLVARADEAVRTLAGRAQPLQRDVSFGLLRCVLEERARQLAELDHAPSLDRGRPDDERRRAVRALAEDALGATPSAVDCAAFFGELLDVPMPGGPHVSAAREDPTLMLDRIRLALMDWFFALAKQGPVALLLDDVQWADDASIGLLEELRRELADAPVLFVTSRSELAERRPDFFTAGTVRIEPRALIGSEVKELAESTLGHALDPKLVRLLSERTAGNPLFVEQIVLALRDERGVHDHATSLPLPLTVEAAVQSRLDHLPGEEKELLKRAAVFDGTFGARELEALGLFDSRATLDALVRRDFLSSQVRRSEARGREYRFRSRLVRDVAYRLVSGSLRTELHLRAAEWLAESPAAEPEEVARHFDQAGRGASAAAWYERAALSAARRADASSVVRCAERAIELDPHGGPRFELHMATSDALHLLGRLDAQEHALDRALADARTDSERARASTDRAVWLLRSGRSSDALGVAIAAVSAARESNETEVLALARGRQGAILTYVGEIDASEAALKEAASLARSASERVRATVAVWRAQLAGARGDLGNRRDAYAEAVRLYEATGDMRCAAGAEMNLADVHNRFGAYSFAEEALRKAVDRCRRVGNRLMEGYALLNLGYSLARLGRPTDALDALGQAAEIASETGEARLALFVSVYEARALLPDRAPDAVKRAQKAAGEAVRLELASLAVLAFTALARAHLELGQRTEALDSCERAMAFWDELGGVEEDEADVFVTYARALDACGRHAAAHEARLRGRSRLNYISRRIGDGPLRDQFLEGVPEHRELLDVRG